VSTKQKGKNEMIKKFTAFSLALLLIFALTGCGGSSNQTKLGNDSKAQTAADKVAVTIDNMVLLDQDGLMITALELVEDPLRGLSVKVLIENNTAANLGVQCKSLIVNGYMMTELFSNTVAAGKKVNDTIFLSSAQLEAAGITSISDITMSFHIFDPSSFATLFDTNEIEIRTSAYGTIPQPAMDDGKELFNQDGIRIVGRYIEDDTFWGTGVMLFIENNHGENIIVQSDNMSINGFMVTPYFSSTVNTGRKALSEITIMSNDLDKNNIDKIENIELNFKILNPDSFQTILETGPIAFSI